jgi:hypothetical protein
MSVPISFPNYFSTSVGNTGFVSEASNRPREQLPQSVPAVSHMYNSSQIFPHLQNLARETKKICLAEHHEYETNEDELAEVVEKLFRLADSYESVFRY